MKVVKSSLRVFLIVFFLVLVCTEITLRFAFGFCDALLYQSSNRYEYITQPNQDRRRFGARLMTNSYSQRSEEPDSTKTINMNINFEKLSIVKDGSGLPYLYRNKCIFAKTIYSV